MLGGVGQGALQASPAILWLCGRCLCTILGSHTPGLPLGEKACGNKHGGWHRLAACLP